MAPVEPESISDHMYRMAMISMVLPMASEIKRERCIMIALVHDLAEAIVGDITPDCGVAPEDKHRMEAEAMTEITKDLAPEMGAFVRNLWHEYESGSSAEAQLVKQIDKFEFALQAAEYHKSTGKDFTDFVHVIDGCIKDKHLRAVYDELCDEHAQGFKN
jgi:putative hydrolase of HD superfamily